MHTYRIFDTDSNFSVKVTYEENLTVVEEVKLKQAADHIYKTFNSKNFQEKILNYAWRENTYKGFWRWKKISSYRVYRAFSNNEGRSNKEVFNHLIKGKENLSDKENSQMDITVKIDRRNKRSVLGYTYPNSVAQYIYTLFFKNGSVEEIAGNMVHEWVHKMGYKHGKYYSTSRQNSVPYGVGYLVRDHK